MIFPWKYTLLSLIILCSIMVISISIGPVYISSFEILKIVTNKLQIIEIEKSWPQSFESIILNIRMPRVFLAGIVGLALSISGASYQALFKNPLADPYLLGIASGAALSVTIVMTQFENSSLITNFIPVSAFSGAIICVTATYYISTKQHGSTNTLILSGIAIASITQACTSFLMLYSNPDLRPLLSWILGGFASAQWDQILIIGPYILISTIISISISKYFNLIQLNQEHSQQLGLNTQKIKLNIVINSSINTAAAVSFAGIIGFVGLICPHIIRNIFGGDYRNIIPLSGIFGAILLVLSDTISRTILNPVEIPVGILTALFGGPFFLYLLAKTKNQN